MPKQGTLSSIEFLKLGHLVSIPYESGLCNRQSLVIVGDFKSPNLCCPERFMVAISPFSVSRTNFNLFTYGRNDTARTLIGKLASLTNNHGLVILDPAKDRVAFRGHHNLNLSSHQRFLCNCNGLLEGQVYAEGTIAFVEGLYVCKMRSSLTPFVALRECDNPSRSFCVPIHEVSPYKLKP